MSSFFPYIKLSYQNGKNLRKMHFFFSGFAGFFSGFTGVAPSAFAGPAALPGAAPGAVFSLTFSSATASAVPTSEGTSPGVGTGAAASSSLVGGEQVAIISAAVVRTFTLANFGRSETWKESLIAREATSTTKLLGKLARLHSPHTPARA